MPRSVPDGVYEHPVTEELEEAIAALDPHRRSSLRPVTAEAAPTILARHLGREAERVLGALQKRREPRRRGCWSLRSWNNWPSLAASNGVEAEPIRAQRLSGPLRELLAIDRGVTPDRPASPLALSTLLTRNRRDPALGHELAREIATADRIDAVLAFVTVGGVRSVREALEGLARRSEGGGRMRLLTTTFTGTTEIEALDMLGRLPGVRIKVSHDIQRTRLHAKAWLFHRDTGLSTAYIGSANFTATALTSGHEWTVKVCAADLPHVIEKFEGTFDTLWNDPEFEDFDPDGRRIPRAPAGRPPGDAGGRPGRALAVAHRTPPLPLPGGHPRPPRRGAQPPRAPAQPRRRGHGHRQDGHRRVRLQPGVRRKRPPPAVALPGTPAGDPGPGPGHLPSRAPGRLVRRAPQRHGRAGAIRAPLRDHPERRGGRSGGSVRRRPLAARHRRRVPPRPGKLLPEGGSPAQARPDGGAHRHPRAERREIPPARLRRPHRRGAEAMARPRATAPGALRVLRRVRRRRSEQGPLVTQRVRREPSWPASTAATRPAPSSCCTSSAAG